MTALNAARGTIVVTVPNRKDVANNEIKSTAKPLDAPKIPATIHRKNIETLAPNLSTREPPIIKVKKAEKLVQLVKKIKNTKP